MTQINNTDRILLLLRLQLQRLKETQTKRIAGATRKDSPSASALERLRQLSATAELKDEDISKLLISGILTEEFGTAASNEAKFQKLTQDVLAAIQSDPEASELMRGVLGMMRRK